MFNGMRCIMFCCPWRTAIIWQWMHLHLTCVLKMQFKSFAENFIDSLMKVVFHCICIYIYICICIVFTVIHEVFVILINMHENPRLHSSIKSMCIYIVQQNSVDINKSHYLDDPIRMYACHGNEPNPASSPPTIRRCAVCFATEMPQPAGFSIDFWWLLLFDLGFRRSIED